MLIAVQARETRKDERIERLDKPVAAFKQAAVGRKSEKANLALTDLETAIAAIHAEDETDPAEKKN
jgi:transposase